MADSGVARLESASNAAPARADDPEAAPARGPDGGDAILRGAAQILSEALLVVDARGRVVMLNDAAERVFGAAARTTPLLEWPGALGIFLDDTRTRCPPEELPIVQAWRGRAVEERDLFVRNPDVPRGLWLSASAKPLTDESGRLCGAVSILRDVTRRKRVERALAEERQLLKLRSRRQSALADIELAVNTPDELTEVLNQVVRLTVRHLPCDDASVMRWSPEDPSLRCEASTLTGLVTSAAAWSAETDGGATRWVVEHDQPLTVSNVRDDPFRITNLFGEAGPRAYAAVPLTDDQRVVGVLYALARSDRRFTQDDLDFLGALASRASTALTKVRLYEQLRELNETLRMRTAQVQENERRFRTMADTAPVLIWMTGADAALTYLNRTWLDFAGTSLDQEIKAGWSHGVHPDDAERCGHAREAGFEKRRPFSVEYRRRRADGVYRWLIDTGTPRRSPDGEFLGFIGSCTDITVRKEAESSLRRHREHLEAVVTARTAELKASHERLRVADRLATIGTLTAGLGHDMNNLLFPIRCRLDAVDPDAVPEDLADTLNAISRTVEYLQQLSDGLRLFARDPDDDGAAGATTSLSAWWEQVWPLLSRANEREVRVECTLDDDLPPVRIAPHRLTQAILNLAINAAEAMPDGGTVRVWAEAGPDGRTVRIGVSDGGQGMSPEVRLRAFDPFFTTKTRTLSTGLGLSLVHGVVTAAGGSIDLDSQVGKGTTVVLTLPAVPLSGDGDSNGRGDSRRAAVPSVADPRREAWIVRCLQATGYDVVRASDEPDVSLCIMDATASNLAAARRFLSGRPDRRVIGIGAPTPGWDARGVTIVNDVSNLQSLQAAVEAAAHANGEVG
ncbi:MAG: PAS domain S-box protein [Planctomycetota bacterium]